MKASEVKVDLEELKRFKKQNAELNIEELQVLKGIGPKKFKFDVAKELAKMTKELTCVFCGKRITQVVWDSQAPYVLDCFHSLGGGIGSYGDFVFNATFCSRECLDQFISLCKNFTYIDYLIGDAELRKKPIKILIKDKKMMKWLEEIPMKRRKIEKWKKQKEKAKK